jgi:hypothetical protein
MTLPASINGCVVGRGVNGKRWTGPIRRLHLVSGLYADAVTRQLASDTRGRMIAELGE